MTAMPFFFHPHERYGDATEWQDVFLWELGLLNAKAIYEKLEAHTGQFTNNFGITKEDMVRKSSLCSAIVII